MADFIQGSYQLIITDDKGSSERLVGTDIQRIETEDTDSWYILQIACAGRWYSFEYCDKTQRDNAWRAARWYLR